MPPRDENAEEKVESAEPGGKKPCSPGRGTEHSKAAENHETNAHDWNGRNGKRAAGDDARAIEQQPGGWERRLQSHPKEREGEERAGDQGRQKSESNFAAGTGKDGQAAAVRFPEDGEQGDGDGQQTFS